ncbi:hypothetical protein KBA27_02350 [bacterium]|nr:hypothetical protein [bacterium]
MDKKTLAINFAISFLGAFLAIALFSLITQPRFHEGPDRLPELPQQQERFTPPAPQPVNQAMEQNQGMNQRRNMQPQQGMAQPPQMPQNAMPQGQQRMMQPQQGMPQPPQPQNRPNRF